MPANVNSVSRKYLPVTIVLVAVSSILATAVSRAGQNSNSDFHSQALLSSPIIGTWECSGGPPPFKVTKNFNAGGTMMEIDNISPFESPTIGSWKQTGPLTFFLVARQFIYDPSGNFLGTFHYTQPLTMDSSRNSIAGTFQATLVDPNGTESDGGSGEVNCARMPLESHP